jgi:integrase
MTTTYDVRIHKTEVWEGKKTTTHYVRWKVGSRPWKEPFKTRALADSFRSDLMSASRRGEAFDVATGRPISMSRPSKDMTWYAFACDYMDMKWSPAAATYRRSLSEALTAITPALFDTDHGQPDGVLIRSALHKWAFNTNRRNDPSRPYEVTEALRWVEQHTKPVSCVSDPSVLRAILSTIENRLDGTAAAASVVSKRRRVLFNALEYAVELGLLRAVGDAQRGRPRLVAFFGLMYFSALRPEEAANVRKHNLALPGEGWGELHIDEATPYAGTVWTNSGRHRDQRQLKNRARGEGRTVPCPPELTTMLHDHLARFGTADDGRLFPGERVEELPHLTYMRTWRAARRATFTDEIYASPLARTPYALRHACVSTWLNGGVPATQVAEWAGHSVEVLLKVYAKCLDGHDETARRRVQEALGHHSPPT